MSDLIDAITKTRELTADIFAKSLADIDDLSEVEIREKLLSGIKNKNEIFPIGWYSPPPSGVAILLDKEPFKRLRFETLRKPISWPNKISKFEKETVGMIYFSPVDRKTKMLGDLGLTIYIGNNEEIKEHIKKCYDNILVIAKHAEIGMKFSELCTFAANSLKNEFEIIGWITRSLKSQIFMNFGHTIPGSFENDFTFGNTFEDIRESITTKRIFINEVENFKIPRTCAFTVETRLLSSKKPHLPVVYFHFIVCFNNGKKTILENFNQIFETIGMNYMNLG